MFMTHKYYLTLYLQQLKQIKMYNFLKVTGISDLKENAKGLKYVTVGFRPLVMLPNGMEVFSNQREKTRTLFGANGDIKADPLFEEILAGKVKVGALVEGSIQSFQTTPYQPEGFKTPVTTYSCVVFKGENGTTYASRQLKQNYATVVDPTTGDLVAPQNLERPIGIDVQAPTSLQDLK